MVLILITKKEMKKLIFTMIAMMAFATTSFAQINYGSTTIVTNNARNDIGISGIYSTTNPDTRYQQSYTRNDGTYVNGHYKTESNNTNWDNYSTQGNTNVYTGTTGSRARDYSSNANNYGSGHTIQTGSRGGQYYINSNGNKTYVPKRNSFVW